MQEQISEVFYEKNHAVASCDFFFYVYVLLGCGLSLTDDTVSFVSHFVKNCTTKLLIDADGINAISKNINILKEKKADIVLPPHI